jgi:hypothetical protein
MRCAVLEIGGPTVVSAYLLSVSAGRPCPILGAPSLPTRIYAVVGLASHGGPSTMGTWQGWPCSRLLGSLRRHVAAPDPFPREKEVRPPEASPDGQAHRGLASTRGGAGTPWGSRPVVAIPEHPALVGTWRRRTYKSTGGGPKTMIPAVRPGPYASSPKGQG